MILTSRMLYEYRSRLIDVLWVLALCHIVSRAVLSLFQPILCEILLTLMEYTKTVMFMWMFIEGIYLHNMVAVSVFSGGPNYIVYYLLGWGK